MYHEHEPQAAVKKKASKKVENGGESMTTSMQLRLMREAAGQRWRETTSVSSTVTTSTVSSRKRKDIANCGQLTKCLGGQMFCGSGSKVSLDMLHRKRIILYEYVNKYGALPLNFS